MKITIHLEKGKHREQDVVFFIFPKDQKLIGAIKTLGFARWSQTRGKWYVPEKDFNLTDVCNAFRDLALVDYSALPLRKGEKGNAECRIKNAELRMQNSELKSKIVTQRDTEKAQRGTERKENAECRIKNAELRMQN